MACKDDDGADLHVARAKHKVRNISSCRGEIHGIWLSKFFTMFQGGVCPGKLNPNHSGVCISYGGQEIVIQEYEILVQVHICICG